MNVKTFVPNYHQNGGALYRQIQDFSLHEQILVSDKKTTFLFILIDKASIQFGQNGQVGSEKNKY